jgi:hypothetical protein
MLRPFLIPASPSVRGRGSAAGPVLVLPPQRDPARGRRGCGAPPAPPHGLPIGLDTMASLTAHRTNTAAVKAGEWVPLGPDYGDIEIFTRGQTDDYLDAQATRQRTAARGFNGDTTRLPVAIRRAINIGLLLEMMLMDVRNLTEEPTAEEKAAALAEKRKPVGRTIEIEEFKEMLRSPDWAEVAGACFAAAERVGRDRIVTKTEDLAVAGPSSEPPSTSS